MISPPGAPLPLHRALREPEVRIRPPPAVSQMRTRPKASAICLLRVGSPLVLSSVHWVRSELVAVAEPVEDAAGR